MKGMKQMDGLGKRICQLIVLCLSLSCLSVLQAQDSSSRIERAFVRDSQLLVQISVPRGRTIESAAVRTSDQQIELNAAPVPSEQTVWLVLDRSEAVINAAPAIQTGIQRFMNGFDEETRIGVILYNNESSTYAPSRNRTEIGTWLSGYSGLVNSPNCIGQALETLQQQLADDGSVHRVVVIAGGLVRQGACSDTMPNLAIPVDFVIVADSFDTLYEDLHDLSGGRLLRANLQTIANRLDQIKSFWSNPVYELSGNFSSSATVGELEIRLSDGTSEQLPLTIEVIQLAELIQPTSASNGLSVVGDLVTQPAGVISTVAGSTPLPAATVQSSNVVAAPTQIQPTTSAATAVVATAITNSVAVNQVAATQVPVTNPTTQPESAANPVVQPTSVSATLPTAVNVGDTDYVALLTQPSVLVGGGSFMVIGLILLVFFSRKPAKKPIAKTIGAIPQAIPNRNFQSPQPINRHNETRIEATLIEADTPAPVDELEITEMLEESDLVKVDMFEVTEIVTEDELRAGNKPVIVALLWDETAQTTYAIRRPHTLLGRQANCDIVITESAVSREHLRFVINDDDEIEVSILTQNPVLHNEERMSNRAKLQIGDVIQVTPATKLTVIRAE
jgi:hypothetical protein